MISIFHLDQMNAEQRKRIHDRAQANIDQVRAQVSEIIQNVRAKGDAALVEYTRKFDDPQFTLDRLKVTEADFTAAYAKTSPTIIAHIRDQISLARKFHTLQRKHIRDWEEETEPGILVGEKWTAIDEVGLYVPGGKNPFPTVQQILAVAAKTAGCGRIVSCMSPRGENYEVLVAAREAGIAELYRVSGPHAIAAMAYGTQTIRPVQLIAGPGNPYVTCAKMLCQERIAIDMPAGPSEGIILADASESAEVSLALKARYCAADILARAEHGPDSAGVMVTESTKLAELTREEVLKQTPALSRQKYLAESLTTYSAIVVTKTFDEAIAFTNSYAPEHLEILTANPRGTLEKITNAGSAFLGSYNPIATGDYAIGINHILPTGTWARRTSAVGVWTFMKRVQYSALTKAALKRLQPIVSAISNVEGLDAHGRSVDIRFE